MLNDSGQLWAASRVADPGAEISARAPVTSADGPDGPPTARPVPGSRTRHAVADTTAAPPVVRAHGADLGVSVTPY
ncbi:hypothetical protein QF032_001689 [Streptomyces achromogenes]|uniref:hypothetical protein n=1 Tax=Streptomyces achromogenes TaxID=67255 RepID=UPI00277DA6FA|nr:hypothetical protein [Streptomyces achromogenes]MDQ0829845.1 hypothetical protein [Streptomyces achromogenes]